MSVFDVVLCLRLGDLLVELESPNDFLQTEKDKQFVDMVKWVTTKPKIKVLVNIK